MLSIVPSHDVYDDANLIYLYQYELYTSIKFLKLMF